ncbi:MAG: hypothetical protein V4850_22550 [Myxococcota bacterium]
MLPALFGPSTDAELDRRIGTLRLVDGVLVDIVEAARRRATVGRVQGVTLCAPPGCVVAQLRLGNLSVHLSLHRPRYFVGAVDDLWRLGADATLVCRHEAHDIDPVVALPQRLASTPDEAVEQFLALARELREAVPSWELTAAYWHGRLGG